MLLNDFINAFQRQLRKTNKQYGFLPGRNTMDALDQVIEDWKRARDEKKTTHAVFLISQKHSEKGP
jgi:hypothetical protein